MSDKVAIVTGANKGLGFAIVKGLCEKYDGIVYLTSRDKNRGKQACKELEKLGLNPFYYQLDVTNNDSIEKFKDHIKKRHGKVDLLVNNAGVLFLKDASESRDYQAEETVKVNFFSLVNFTEAVVPLLGNGGKILNISSSSGHLSRLPSEILRKKFQSTNLTLEELKKLMCDYVQAVKDNRDKNEGWGDSCYVVSKIGVNAYTFMLQRKLLDKDILVNCVHPGYVMSDMTRGGGSITPEQGAIVPLKVALQAETGGLFVWHDGTVVPWDGQDPREYIDGKAK